MSECRIFVSSPGDVAIERTLVASVVERLKTKFGHRSQLKLILWEQMPLDANDSFQPQLPDPSDAELFLLILWRRIGTPLPDNALPQGFVGPLTGTEYEFLAALRHQAKHQKPAILVYRKMDHQSGKSDSDVDQFFKQHFTDNDDRLLKAFHQFDSTSAFEHQLETHLNAWFDANLPIVSDNALASSRVWDSGNPFQGLKAFRFEQANVFRGRSAAIAQSIERLKNKAAQGQPFLLIMGMSGSGKSSLLRAGILPSLYSPQIVQSVSKFYRGIMRPADIDGDPFAGLVSALSAPSADHILDPSQRLQMLSLCQHHPDEFLDHLRKELSRRENRSQLVLAVDQFEELYTSAVITSDTQRNFVIMLKRMIEELGIWVIATMRSDCYHFLGDTPELLELKSEGGQLDLQPPELFNIRQMISEPAEMAGLHFEQGQNGQPPLNEVIAQSAAKSPESLPLLEFTLSQLYDGRTASGTMTFECYRGMGGIEGAIANHAEQVFSQLKKPVRHRLPAVFNRLVNSQNSGQFTRKWAKLNELTETGNDHTLLQAFLDARLLVAERNPDGDEVVTLAHESLFRHWPRLSQYLEKNKNLLRLRDEINEQVKRWQAAGRDSALLLNAGKPLEDGKALVRSDLTLEPDTKKLIKLSIQRANRNRWAKWGAIASLVVVTIYATIASISASQNQQVAERSLKKSQDLIEFLIGDLHAQLEKLGRLDVMQSIGEKALGYFAELDPRQATDENIANRSKALYQIGSVYVELNEYDSATQAFAQSQELLSLLAQKYPNNFDYLYEYSQASFWVGYAYWAAERLDDAEGYFLEYLKIAKRLVELQPDNLDARMEVSYAYSNLGTLASNRGKTDLATQHFLDSINNSQIILAADPQNQAALSSSADAFSWLGNTYRDRLDLHKAIAYYRSEQRIFSNLVDDQFNYQNRYDLLLSSLRILGMRTYLGELDAALEGYYQALVDIQYLVNHDPANTSWRNSRVFTFANIAKIELLLGNLENSQQAFTKSYELEPNLPQNAEKIWADDYLERHYWYWRFLHKTQRTEQAKDIAQQLMEQSSPRAIKWQMRLASATDLPFDAPPFTETILMQGPDTVLAHLEYALFRNDQTTVERISQYLPTEMWANPELKTIKQQLSPTPNP